MAAFPNQAARLLHVLTFGLTPTGPLCDGLLGECPRLEELDVTILGFEGMFGGGVVAPEGRLAPVQRLKVHCGRFLDEWGYRMPPVNIHVLDFSNLVHVEDSGVWTLHSASFVQAVGFLRLEILLLGAVKGKDSDVASLAEGFVSIVDRVAALEVLSLPYGHGETWLAAVTRYGDTLRSLGLGDYRGSGTISIGELKLSVLNIDRLWTWISRFGW